MYHVCARRVVSGWATPRHRDRLSSSLNDQQDVHSGLQQQPRGKTQQLASIRVPQRGSVVMAFGGGSIVIYSLGAVILSDVGLLEE